jgi:hypothetical protein
VISLDTYCVSFRARTKLGLLSLLLRFLLAPHTRTFSSPQATPYRPPSLTITTTMQRATCTGIRIRSPSDARTVFHAVVLDILPMVTRRLDTEERGLIQPGAVYVWEERGPHAELTGVCLSSFHMPRLTSLRIYLRLELNAGRTVRSNVVTGVLGTCAYPHSGIRWGPSRVREVSPGTLRTILVDTNSFPRDSCSTTRSHSIHIPTICMGRSRMLIVLPWLSPSMDN